MKGFEEALSILNYGEKGSFIIPSNLAFDKYPFIFQQILLLFENRTFK